MAQGKTGAAWQPGSAKRYASSAPERNAGSTPSVTTSIRCRAGAESLRRARTAGTRSDILSVDGRHAGSALTLDRLVVERASPPRRIEET